MYNHCNQVLDADGERPHVVKKFCLVYVVDSVIE